MAKPSAAFPRRPSLSAAFPSPFPDATLQRSRRRDGKPTGAASAADVAHRALPQDRRSPVDLATPPPHLHRTTGLPDYRYRPEAAGLSLSPLLTDTLRAGRASSLCLLAAAQPGRQLALPLSNTRLNPFRCLHEEKGSGAAAAGDQRRK